MGYALLNYMQEDGHLMNLAVRPEVQNLGVGSALLIKTIEFAEQQGVKRITLEVRPSNTAARRLYHKFGFEQVGIRTKYYSETNEDGLILWTGDTMEQDFHETLNRIRAQTRQKILVIDKID